MLFGTSGIRGIYPKEINPELIFRVGNAFAEEGEEIYLGRDKRESSELLEEAFIAGVLAKGANVIKVGEVPTPTLALKTQAKKCKGAIITASHNPQHYNGIKLFHYGYEISNEEEKIIERNIEKIVLNDWKKVGKTKEEDAIKDHLELIVKSVDKKKIEKKELKVIIDCNGVGSVIAPRLLRKLNCKVYEINFVERGFLRNSEPTEENLGKLKEEVVKRGADIGIAFDGDADRGVIIDENGEMLKGDVQLAIAIENELKKKRGKIVSTVESSILIDEVVKKNNCKLIKVAVGSKFVSKAVKEEGAIFGGEPAGEFIYANGVLTPDGIMLAAKFVEIAKESNISELSKKYKTYPIIRKKVAVKDKIAVMNRIKEEIDLEGEKNFTDGIRIDFKDGFILVRASGTEPIIRITVECKDEEKLKIIANNVEKKILKINEESE